MRFLANFLLPHNELALDGSALTYGRPCRLITSRLYCRTGAKLHKPPRSTVRCEGDDEGCPPFHAQARGRVLRCRCCRTKAPPSALPEPAGTRSGNPQARLECHALPTWTQARTWPCCRPLPTYGTWSTLRFGSAQSSHVDCFLELHCALPRTCIVVLP